MSLTGIGESAATRHAKNILRQYPPVPATSMAIAAGSGLAPIKAVHDYESVHRPCPERNSPQARSSQQGSEGGGCYRPADEIALHVVAAAGPQEIDLRLGFHPFCNHLDLQ